MNMPKLPEVKMEFLNERETEIRDYGYEVGYQAGFEAAKEQIIELARAKGVKPFIFPEMPKAPEPAEEIQSLHHLHKPLWALDPIMQPEVHRTGGSDKIIN